MKMLQLQSGLIQNRRGYLWFLLLIFGLISNESDARAVNISNTWTLPHDGFTVFYRFFRDQISWFEADAVCQFHHANLVTVTNSVEFDASREFLRILDVTEPVWIGLMRSQNSDRFFWSNSKPLGATTEYWAESLPVIDAPLCAVIDPVRDYRWHALRCGGPETASFLCEMNVPSWAEECVIRDIPSLTIQYMADSGTVEITKDCGDDEGIIHQVCRGKQDLDKIINSLVCKNEKIQQEISQIFSQERQNLIINSDLLDSHKKSIEIIKNTQTDNNEDNNINIQNNNRLHPVEKISEQETENPVQKLIEQFDVEELMQADQPQEEEHEPQQQSSSETQSETSDERILKLLIAQTNGTKQPYRRQREYERRRIIEGKSRSIMTDQPAIEFGDNDDLNEIQEPLPHTKKMLPQDLKHEYDVTLSKDADYNKNLKEKNFDKILSTTTVQSAIDTGTIHSISDISTGSVTLDTTDDIATATVTATSSSATAMSDLTDDVNETNGVTATLTPASPEGNKNIVTADSTKRPTIDEELASVVTGVTHTSSPDILTDHTNSADSTITISTSHVSVTTFSPGEFKPTPAVTIGHPMHPQQPRSNVISEETAHQHIKETNDNHFIPPMLMVKSHYQSPKSGLGHNPEHQLDLQIIRKKSSPSDLDESASNEEINHHSTDEHITITATTTKTIISGTTNTNHDNNLNNGAKMTGTENIANDQINSESTAEIISENLPITVLDGEKLTLTTLTGSTQLELNRHDVPTLTTLKSQSDDAIETKLIGDKNSSRLNLNKIPATATVAPNQIVQIRFSNDDYNTENPTTISITTKPVIALAAEIDSNFPIKSSAEEVLKSSTTMNTAPSLTSSLPLLNINENIESHFIKNPEGIINSNNNNDDDDDDESRSIKLETTDNLSNAESFKNSPSTSSISNDNVSSKANFPTTLTTAVEESSIVASVQKTLDELSTTSSTTQSNIDSKSFMVDNINNFTTAVSSSESDQKQQNNNNKNNNNNNNNKKQGHHIEEEYSTATHATTTTIKTLIPTKKTTLMKKRKGIVVSSLSSSISSSKEEDSEGHHDETKKTAADVYTSDEENFQPHKPNRRRVLTKPETTSYLKKILG